MSNTSKKGLTSKQLLLLFAAMTLSIGAIAAFWGSSWSKKAAAVSQKEKHESLAMTDPLPSELVFDSMVGDSLQDVRKEDLRRAMTKVIQNYRKKFRHDYFTGYFMTDLDRDGLPELWVKVGSYRDNSKLELYYPMPDGTLRKSDTYAEPGQYYIGDDYIMQVVGAGPGYIDINRISIVNGSMYVENERSIDLYSDPDAYIPTFAEHEIRDSSLNNLTSLNKALQL